MIFCWESGDTLCSVLEYKGFWDDRKTALWFWDGHFPLRCQRKISKKELRKSSYAFASVLIKKFGVKRGEPIAIILPNTPEFIFAYFGIWLAGAVVAPINLKLTKHEFASMIKGAGIKRIVVLDKVYPEIADIDTLEDIIVVRMSEVFPSFPVPKGLVYIHKAAKENFFVGIPETDTRAEDFKRLLKEGKKNPSLYFPQLKPESNALMLFTSGTTGIPKIVVHTHKSLKENTISCKKLLSEILGKEDFKNEVFLALAAYFHIMGISTMLHLPLMCGSKIVLIFPFPNEDFGSKLLSAINFTKASIFVGVPRLYDLMIESFEKSWKWKFFDFSCLKICISGAVALPQKTREWFTRIFGRNILEGYGMSESGITHCQKYGISTAGSVGAPLPGVEHKILDPDEKGRGEILVKSPGLMKGYSNVGQEEEIFIDEDGWLHTADLGYVTDKNELFLTGRKRYIIKTKHGENIYPIDIENILYSSDLLKEAVVVGRQEEDGYQDIFAYVVLKEEPNESYSYAELENDLKEYCKRRTSLFKIPKKIYFIKELPKNIFGKVLRNELK